MHATPSHRVRLLEIFAVQMVFLAGLSAILDGGVLRTAYAIPMTAYWVSVLALVLRTHMHPAQRDLAYIRLGWLVIIPVGMFAILLFHGWISTH